MTPQYREERCGSCGTARKALNGTWLREQMHARRITFKALGEACNLSPQYLSDVVMNRRALSADALTRLLAALEDPRVGANRKRKFAPRGIPR